MKSEENYKPFSQRNGLAPIPPQLELGEVSKELRRLVSYYIDLEIRRGTKHGYVGSYFNREWTRISEDLHVEFFKKSVRSFDVTPEKARSYLGELVQKADIGRLFDLVEFLYRHPLCSEECKADLREAFVRSRAAYRIMDEMIVAVGTEQQGAAVEAAISDATQQGAVAARRHLVSAGKELRNGNWSGSVRESIHAVEAMALKLDPSSTTLGPALGTLEKEGYLHGALKSAFSALYGYSSDEEGVRHALVLKDEANVDEADALFMLGACASFVSFLIARTG